MMKNIINLIFAKNTKSSFVNTSQSAENVQRTRVQTQKNQAANAQKVTHQNSSTKTENVQQTFSADNEFKSLAFESAYEVEEISLDDFKYTGPERRKFPRKPGETRSCYSKNNQTAQSVM